MRKRRPDIIVVLAVLVGLGVLATGLTQGLIRDAQGQAKVETAYQPGTFTAR